VEKDEEEQRRLSAIVVAASRAMPRGDTENSVRRRWRGMSPVTMLRSTLTVRYFKICTDSNHEKNLIIYVLRYTVSERTAAL
jgi:hypothetical protein